MYTPVYTVSTAGEEGRYTMVPLKPICKSDSNDLGASQTVTPCMGSTYGRLILFDWLHQPCLYSNKKDDAFTFQSNSIMILLRGSAFFKKVFPIFKIGMTIPSLFYFYFLRYSRPVLWVF